MFSSSKFISSHTPNSMWSWGYNMLGSLGDASTINKLFPAKFASSTWKKVSASSGRCNAIRSDDTLWAWGYGISGDGTNENRTYPVMIGNSSWRSCAAGANHSIGIRSDGTLWGWGRNDFGENGTNAQRLSPFQITTGSWSKVAAGVYVSYAIRSDGTLWTWGMSMGIGLSGPNAYTSSPTQIGSSNWFKISAGDGHVLGIKSDGTLWSWGYNNYGQLGDGTRINRDAPSQIGTGTWSDVAAGDDHSLAIKSDGTLWAWGENTWGQVGNGIVQNINQPNPYDVLSPIKIGNSTWKSVSAGDDFSLAIKSDGTLWSWGYNKSKTSSIVVGGKLGNAAETIIYRSSPSQVGSHFWKSVSAGGESSVGILAGANEPCEGFVCAPTGIGAPNDCYDVLTYCDAMSTQGSQGFKECVDDFTFWASGANELSHCQNQGGTLPCRCFSSLAECLAACQE